MQRETDELYEALSLLGELLDSRGLPAIHLIVCGGAALRATGIVGRVTKDVDVQARRGQVDGELIGAWPLPEGLRATVVEVATELELPKDWLNASTSMLMVPLEDLPPELWSDLQEEEFGSSLRIGFVGRTGQLYLKMYAAIKRQERRDVSDLVALSPTPEECRQIEIWLRDGDLLDRAKEERLTEVLKEVHHG